MFLPQLLIQTMKSKIETHFSGTDVRQRLVSMDRQFGTEFVEWVTDPYNMNEIRLYLCRTLDTLSDHSQLSQVIAFVTENWSIADTAELIFTTIPFHQSFLQVIGEIMKSRSFYDAVDLLSYVCVDESYPRLRKIISELKTLNIEEFSPLLKEVGTRLSWRDCLIMELL
eukprot:NODE_19_length_47148_cov_1.447810.p35 type:complete len:169 gc:universal NODE_19_length_47148_cov_1.447810:4734-4228(-)